jgi:TRAP-type C4-dicarboxylate transport system permease large subunit
MMAATFSVVMLITYVPELTSWLPRLLASMG